MIEVVEEWVVECRSQRTQTLFLVTQKGSYLGLLYSIASRRLQVAQYHSHLPPFPSPSCAVYTIIDMSERRRAEIEAKKAKLAELRKAREERQKLDNERKNLEVNMYRLLI